MSRSVHVACFVALLGSGCVLERSGTGDGADGSVGRDAGAGMDAGRSDAGRIDAGDVDAARPDAGTDAGGCAEGTVDLDRDPANGCECVIAPQACEGRDDDCDGVVDEGCDCTPSGRTRDCGSDVGACRFGTQTCQPDGTWGACEGAIGPSAEVCNAVDDDCDGTVDAFSRACGSAVGLCTVGTETCAGGSFSPCSGVGPRDEVCDGVEDENCDGVVDDGCECSGTMTRPCRVFGCAGVETCAAGRYGSCVPTSIASESCNGRDDDCNGVIDDGAADCPGDTGCDLVRLATGVYLFCYQSPGNDQRRSWTEARDRCAMFGYHLVTIDDAAEDAALAAVGDPLDSGDWWIGVNDLDDDGRYRWVGPGSMYVNFRSAPAAGNCGVLDSAMMDWEVKGCGGGKPFICEAPAP